ncbi:MAG: hypothetical protein ABI354_00475 [Candidatus Saccharimonadales bacterium]
MSSKTPSNWFDDDPEWEKLRLEAAKRPISKELKQKIAAQQPKIEKPARETPRAQAYKESTNKEVVVNIKLALPKVKIPDLKHIYTVHKRQVNIVAAGLVTLLIVFGAFKLISSRKHSNVSGGPTTAKEQAKASFDPLIPLENLTDATGKKSTPEFKYDTKKKVLAYITSYNGANLTISQQQVPKDFKSDKVKLMSVANSVGASDPLDTQKGTAYIATDEKTGSQTAVFATDSVLVFIRTNKVLDSDEWKLYINQLNPA